MRNCWCFNYTRRSNAVFHSFLDRGVSFKRFKYGFHNNNIMQSLTEYMKKELIFYIKQEYDKGIPMTRIRKGLLDGGHHQNLVKEAMSSLKKNNYNLVKALNDPIRSSIDKELYFNIMNSLVKYVEYQLQSGKNQEDVKSILSDYGHSKKVIEQAFNAVNKTTPKLEESMRKTDLFMMLSTFILIFILTGLTQEPLEIVFFGFSPTLLVFLTANIMQQYKVSKKIYWWLPLIFGFFFLLVNTADVFPGIDIDYPKLLGFNLVISLIYVYVKMVSLSHAQNAIDIIREEVMTENDPETTSKNETRSKKNKK